MTILSEKDLEKHKKILENLESAEINGVYIKNLKAIPMEMLIYLRKNLKEPYIHIEIKSNDDFFFSIILKTLKNLIKIRLILLPAQMVLEAQHYVIF